MPIFFAVREVDKAFQNPYEIGCRKPLILHACCLQESKAHKHLILEAPQYSAVFRKPRASSTSAELRNHRPAVPRIRNQNASSFSPRAALLLPAYLRATATAPARCGGKSGCVCGNLAGGRERHGFFRRCTLIGASSSHISIRQSRLSTPKRMTGHKEGNNREAEQRPGRLPYFLRELFAGTYSETTYLANQRGCPIPGCVIVRLHQREQAETVHVNIVVVVQTPV
jgi:hypothetical protein